MRPVFALPAHSSGFSLAAQPAQTTPHAVVSITSSHYDKRGLLSRDGDALAQSLRSLAYLTLANTQLVSQLMLADGGVSLLVRVVDALLVDAPRESSRDSLGDASSASSRHAPRDTPRGIFRDTHSGTPRGSPSDSHSFYASHPERTQLAQHALAAATNLMLRGRAQVRDALVEAGLVDVLVRFLEPVVQAVEALQELQLASPPPKLNDAPLVAPITEKPTEDSNLMMMDIDAISTGTLPHQHRHEMPSVIDNANTEPNTPLPNIPQQQQQQQSGTPESIQQMDQQNHQQQQQSLPHISSAAEPISIAPTATAAPAPAPTQQQQQQQQPAITHQHHRHHDLPLLPGLRLPLPTSPLTATHLSTIIPHQHNILMACKILHTVSKYPHLRHYMHVDSTRPARPSVLDLCGAAISASEVEGPDATTAPTTTIPRAPAAAGLGIDMDVFPNPIPTTIGGPLAAADMTQLRQVTFNRFDTTTPPTTTATPPTTTPTPPTPQTYPPTITTIPLLIFSNDTPTELAHLEHLSQPPTLPSTSYTPAKSHLLQSRLHYLPTPTNPRSAFDLLEIWTSPCTLLPETRTLAVNTLRNAYRRDPVPTPCHPPFTPLTQSMGPVLYLDVDEFHRSGAIRSGGKNLVVGLGHLRRCANGKCGKWEEGYKQFSKCSRCRRVSYCSKGCQRRAWVLHKNWCLKYTGDSGAVAPVASAAAAGVGAEAGGQGGNVVIPLRRRASSSLVAEGAAAAAAAVAVPAVVVPRGVGEAGAENPRGMF
ncbi:hypothetical protein HDU98_000358 [Podochytrium sp. JEL0797]|nr:hypothetical protein HDU98_000358 [Podochytrium sp. JEL0797]